MPHCPLCAAKAVTPFAHDRFREYLHCNQCDLVFVPHRYHPTPQQARERYDEHRNSPDDVGYCRYLRRLIDPMLAILPPGCRGLDFGCGPGPALATLFEAAGHTMALYDIHYAPDTAALETTYDFVTATEVIEHLDAPAKTLDRMLSCVAPGGWLGIMTQLRPPQDQFITWHYKNDFTHLVFYSAESLQWIADRYQTRIQHSAEDVIILHKA